MKLLRALIEGFWDDVDVDSIPDAPKEQSVRELIARSKPITKQAVRALSDAELNDLDMKWGLSNEQLNRTGARTKSAIDTFLMKIERGDVSNVQLTKTIAPGSEPPGYTFVRWSDVFDQLLEYRFYRYEGALVPTGSSAEQYFAKLEGMAERWADMKQTSLANKRLVDDEVKARTKKNNKKGRAAAAAWIEQQRKIIPNKQPATNPQKFAFKTASGIKRVDNLYHKSRDTRYNFVGHPLYYDHWSTPMLLMFHQLSQKMDAEGRPPFKEMYAGKRYGHEWVIIADDNFVWVKKSPSSLGSSSNTLLIDGVPQKPARWIK